MSAKGHDGRRQRQLVDAKCTSEPEIQPPTMSSSPIKLQNVEHKQEIENETPLAKRIKGEGLDVPTWVNHFREVGIQNEESVQHIDRTTLFKLLKKTSQSWEKVALQKLFNKSNIVELTKQENDLKELRRQLPDPRKYLSHTLKQDAAGRTMEFDDKPYMTDIGLERMKATNAKETSGGEIVIRTPLESSDLIRQIAAGQILRGQYIHENLYKSSTCRKQLIRVDGPIEIMSPVISETMEILEFDDKKQSDEFDSVLNQCGVSFALGFCGRIPIIAHGDVKGSGGDTNTSQKKTTMDWQEQFVKINQILIVPTASFTLSNHSVCLSDCALDAITRLYRKFEEKKSPFGELCRSFFNEFGSHFYTGVWHFGGRYKWAVTSITDSQKNRSENYQKAKVALSGSVGGGLLWVGGEVKGGYENDQEQVIGTRTYSEKFKVAKKLEKFGGPQEVDDIPLWKKGLAEYNNTWVLIDKDVSQQCYEGVWTLLQGQESMFPKAESFSKSIQDEWEAIYEKTKSNLNMAWSKHQLRLDETLGSKVRRPSSRLGPEEITRVQMNEFLSTESGHRQFADSSENIQQVRHQMYHQRRIESNK